MRFFTANFKWFMLASGLLTSSMFSGLFSPGSLMKSTFKDTVDGAPAEILVRNWAALIGLMGIMLITGAFVASVRKFALVIAGLSKIIFIGLVLCYGQQYMMAGAGIAVIVDSIMVVLFVIYLLLTRTRDHSST